MEAVETLKAKIVAFLLEEKDEGNEGNGNSDLLDSMVEGFISACENVINECCAEVQRFQYDWKDKRDATIGALEELITAVNKLQFDTNVSNLFGSSVGIVGSVVTIVGIALAPVTLGTSLIVSGVGLGVGAAGGITSLGAILAKSGITKVKQRKIRGIFKTDSDVTLLLSKPLETLVCVIVVMRDIGKSLDGNSHHKELLRLLLNTEGIIEGTSFTETVNTAASGAPFNSDVSVIPLLVPRVIASADDVAALATSLAKPLGRLGGGLLSAINITVNVYTIVMTSIDVSKGSKVKDNDQLQEQLEQLKTEREQLQKVFARFA